MWPTRKGNSGRDERKDAYGHPPPPTGVGVKRVADYKLFFPTQPSRDDDQWLHAIKEHGTTFCPEDMPVETKFSHVYFLA